MKKQKKYNYTYAVYLNNVDSSMYSKIYYGVHSTNNLLDNYHGSGILLWKYLNKHPNDYYFKILQLYSTKEEAYKAEKVLIKEHLGKPYCLNIAEGGNGGNTIAGYNEEQLKEHKENCSKAQKIAHQKPGAKEKHSKGMIGKNVGKVCNEKHKQDISNTLKNKYATGELVSPFKNMDLKSKLSEEQYQQMIDKRSESLRKSYTEERRKDLSKKMSGSGNPMYGKPGVNTGKHRVYRDDGSYYYVKD